MNKWPDEAFAAYVAAMIDGEGHIEIISNYSVRVRIANTFKPTLDEMCLRLGYGRVIEYRGRESRGYKRLFCLEVSNCRDVGRLFRTCGKYIHMKVDQMADAIAICDRVMRDGDAIDARNRAILAEIAKGRIQKEIAKEFGVSPQLVSRIKLGHTWSSVITAHRARALTKTFPRAADQCFRLHAANNNQPAQEASHAA